MRSERSAGLLGPLETREGLEAIFDAAPDGILIVGSDARMVVVNRELGRLFGYHPEELVGEPGTKLIPPSVDLGEMLGRFRRLDAAGASEQIRLEGQRKDGSRFPISVTVRSIRVDGERLYTAIVRDVTVRVQEEEERERLVAELERSNAELQDFASIASHDLQEPLRKIQAFADRLRSVAAGKLDDRELDYLARMENAAERMQALINDLLTYSRVSTRGRPFGAVDLREIATGVLGDLEVRIRETKATVRVDIEPVGLHADALQMRMLLQNLVANALKFAADERHPEVSIAVRHIPGPAGGSCEIIVSDNGIGFDPSHADRIFGIFQRLHGRSQYEGTGIGLAVCRKIVERHLGSITARATPGEGATFRATLPLLQPSPSTNKAGSDDSA